MSVSYNFKGHKVLVTGGSKGLGKAIVKKFVEAGCTSVFVIGRDATRLQELRNEFPVVKTAIVDVFNWDETVKVVEAFGPLDILINNAGVPVPEDILNVTSEGIDRIFGVNFKGYVNISQVVAKGMIKEGKGGTIINVSSVLDEKAIKGMPMYCCTKAAITMLTKSLALELAPHNIRVNCVRPSVMITNFVADPTKGRELYDAITDRQLSKKPITVDDCANSILFLCSNGATNVNGSGILIDAGIYTT